MSCDVDRASIEAVILGHIILPLLKFSLTHAPNSSSLMTREAFKVQSSHALFLSVRLLNVCQDNEDIVRSSWLFNDHRCAAVGWYQEDSVKLNACLGSSVIKSFIFLLLVRSSSRHSLCFRYGGVPLIYEDEEYSARSLYYYAHATLKRKLHQLDIGCGPSPRHCHGHLMGDWL